ncbi:MAG: FAD-dependent oxidoreductase [Pseudomonadota bacterium]
MRTTTRAVVIGGGIAGVSALYHLCLEGWTDVMLLERDELTSGTTWHSAAQVTNFGAIQVMVGLKTHSIKLYKELADDPDYPINYHHADGGLRLATEDWHLDGYRHFQSMAKGMGVEFELIDAEEARRRHPLITTEGLKGALWDPMDGDIDPAQLCQALARRSRRLGAEVHRHTPVTGLTQKPGGEWIVHTPKGDIQAEHVINAGGYRCNEIGAMMGVEHPVASMEHQYFLTEPIPGIEALDHRVPLIRCPHADFYSRQEKQGLLVGFYEQDCRTWGLDGIDPNFTMALSPDDPDRVLPVLEGAIERLPCLAETGIHTIINGPITYTPDGVPLVGPIPGKRNAWCITGLRAGLGEGGGHGWLLAQMMVHGEAVYDTWALDPRRFSRYASIEWTALKAVEDYQNEFRFHRPHEHRPAGRDLRTTPLTPILRAEGAETGPVNGWERALFYRPDAEFEETHSFRWCASQAVVAKEVEAVHTRAGIMEVNGFTRIAVHGAGGRDWLDGLMAGRVPKRPGKVGLAYYLTERGSVAGEVTIALLDETTAWIGSAAAAEHHDLDWFTRRLPADGSITLEPLTDSHTILVIAGPRAEAILAEAAPRTDWRATAFPWLTCQRVHIGHVACVAMAVSFSGERAWELHVPMPQAEAAYRILRAAGAPHGLTPFGMHATESMRLEKGFRHWKADLITEYDPFESGLARFVDLDKAADFPGKQALKAKRNQPPRARFVTLALVSDAAPAHPGDSVLAGEDVVGTVTSAGWGHRVGENLAMAFVRPEHAPNGRAPDEMPPLDILILGERMPARLVAPARFDPEMTRPRGR